MITFFNSTSVYLGYNMQEYHEMKLFLQEQGIKYRTKIHNMNRMGRNGAVPIRAEYTIQYEILIHRKDAERMKLYHRNR